MAFSENPLLERISYIIFGNDGEGQEAPSIDATLEVMDRHLENFETLVKPVPESKPRTSFDSGLPKEEVTLGSMTLKQRLKMLPQAAPLFINMLRAAQGYDGKFNPRKTHATPEFIAELEARAYRAGVKDIKYVKVPRNAIFKGKGIPHEYAIVFTVEMDKEPLDTSPSFESQFEVMKGYKRMAVIGNKLARFMKKSGFAAYPGMALGGVTDYAHLAELAGLGAIGYHGLLITPGEGSRLRINTIYTNIENLPLHEENEHLWVRDFCAMCKKCIRICPADAIFAEPQPRGDGGMQCIDHAACRDYFSRNYGCAVCLAICPFSQVGYEAVKKRFKGNPKAPQFVIPVESISVTRH
ncbi:MAG: reductive dehalogenase domain-containing protein [Ardenticatenaceae bacterium]|nr:reductive dehalogenase domain-containing protein [Ardenticatenaceae bacterium]